MRDCERYSRCSATTGTALLPFVADGRGGGEQEMVAAPLPSPRQPPPPAWVPVGGRWFEGDPWVLLSPCQQHDCNAVVGFEFKPGSWNHANIYKCWCTASGMVQVFVRCARNDCLIHATSPGGFCLFSLWDTQVWPAVVFSVSLTVVPLPLLNVFVMYVILWYGSCTAKENLSLTFLLVNRWNGAENYSR